MVRKTLRELVVAGVMLLAFSPLAHATATLSLTQTGLGSFVLNGSGMDGVAGLDIIVGYDTSLLSNPAVDKGAAAGSAMFAANPNFASGKIRIAIVNPAALQGSGPLATISFTPIGSGTGQMSIAVSAVDANGKALPAVGVPTSASLTAATDTTASQGTADQSTGGSSTSTTSGSTSTSTTSGTTTTSTTVTTATSGQPSWLGTVNLPPEEKAQPSTPRGERTTEYPSASQETSPTVATAGEGNAGTPASGERTATPSGKGSEGELAVHRGVLERFRAFRGERTPAALSALFAEERIAGFSQEPAIALSDGKVTIKVRIETSPEAKSAPNFALKGARLISLRKEKGGWLIVARPEKGAVMASVTVLQGGAMSEFPLTVAPPMTGMAGATAADFRRFLAEKQTEKKPRFDLNGDGRHDYIDDYIYTANYLVHQHVSGAKKKTPRR